MTMQDPISDLLTRMRNAQMAGHTEVQVPNSSMKRSVLKVLEDEMSARNEQMNKRMKELQMIKC